MKVLLKADIEHALIASCPGLTWAEKRSRYSHVIDTNYATILTGYQGTWVDVDIQYLFTMSFNVILDDNGMFDVQYYLVDKVDISPEFNSFEEWVAAVQARYDKDWPGTNATQQMSLWRDHIQKSKEAT